VVRQDGGGQPRRVAATGARPRHCRRRSVAPVNPFQLVVMPKRFLRKSLVLLSLLALPVALIASGGAAVATASTAAGDNLTQVAQAQGQLWASTATQIAQTYTRANAQIHMGAVYWVLGTNSIPAAAPPPYGTSDTARGPGRCRQILSGGPSPGRSLVKATYLDSPTNGKFM
jgi:hypothetical protein